MTDRSKATTHAEVCWSWGPAHHECAVREIERLRKMHQDAYQRGLQAGDGCHCGTCTCNPNMTPAVRFDLSPAQREGAIREHLIRLGWTPPDEHALSQPAAPSGEAVAGDADFLRHIASVCRAAFDLCEPKPRRTPEDVREHYGELCLLELVNIADEIERRLAEAKGVQPAAHPAITHCDNCGCDWLDNGLNPVGCPYCKQHAQAAEVEALRAEVDALRAEVKDYQENGASAVRFAPNSAYWSAELRRLFGDDARNGIEVLEQWYRDSLTRAERLEEALRELEGREQRAEALLRQALEALSRAHQTAMEQTLKARIPECAEFAGIAQDLDFVVAALRERLDEGAKP